MSLLFSLVSARKSIRVLTSNTILMATIWDAVLELTKSAQEKNSDPLLWAIHLSSTLNAAGVSLPSVELADRLVSHICWDNHVPIMWKFLEKASTLRIVPPLFVIALLSARSFFFDHLTCIVFFFTIYLFIFFKLFLT